MENADPDPDLYAGRFEFFLLTFSSLIRIRIRIVKGPLDPDLDPYGGRCGSRIRIRIKTNADLQYCFMVIIVVFLVITVVFLVIIVVFLVIIVVFLVIIVVFLVIVVIFLVKNLKTKSMCYWFDLFVSLGFASD